QGFQVQGASAALAVLAALTTLTLILPNLATSIPGPVFSTAQLVFAGAVSLVLYVGFIFVQTVRHRDYFLPVGSEREGANAQRQSTSPWSLTSGCLSPFLVRCLVLSKRPTPVLGAA